MPGCGYPPRTPGADYCRAHYLRNWFHGDPQGGPDPTMRRRDPALRFWPKVNKNGPVPDYRPDLGSCWLWTGAKDGDRYGSFGATNRSGNKGIGAHVFAYQETVGPVPDGLELDHLCRVTSCCNPAHLEPVTPEENQRRAAEARRLTGGYDPGKRLRERTHCPRGHEFTPENTYTHPNQRGRKCRTCVYDNNRKLTLRNIGKT